MKIRFLVVARREIREAVAYYERQRIGLGNDFREEVEAILERIRAFPESCQSLGATIRRCRLRRFPYGLIYRLSESEILIVAVANLHRNPEHWKDRL